VEKKKGGISRRVLSRDAIFPARDSNGYAFR